MSNFPPAVPPVFWGRESVLAMLTVSHTSRWPLFSLANGSSFLARSPQAQLSELPISTGSLENFLTGQCPCEEWGSGPFHSPQKHRIWLPSLILMMLRKVIKWPKQKWPSKAKGYFPNWMTELSIHRAYILWFKSDSRKQASDAAEISCLSKLHHKHMHTHASHTCIHARMLSNVTSLH